MIRQDLPQRFGFATPTVDPAFGHMVQALDEFRDTYVGQNLAAENREAARLAASKLPSKRWPQTYARRMRLCQVEPEHELPAVWLAMAEQGVKQDRATIQEFLRANCEAQLGQSSLDNRAPECTADLSKDMGQLRFMSGPSNVDVGISIFMLSSPSADLAAKISASTGMYDQQMQSTTTLTMTEVMDLKKAQRFKLPTNFIEVKNVSWGYHHFLAVILGFEHTLTIAFGKLVRLLESQEQYLHPIFDGSVHHCSGLLRGVQINVHEWLAETLAGRVADTPKFHQVVQNIKRQCWMVPSMPRDFLEMVKGTEEPRPASTSTKGSATATNAATPTRTYNLKAPASALNLNVVPLQPKFQAYNFIDAHGMPPKNDKGQAMCLNFHVLGKCYRNCRRKSDHRKHTETDSKKLAKYLASAVP
jgi:hypothetical protein